MWLAVFVTLTVFCSHHHAFVQRRFAHNITNYVASQYDAFSAVPKENGNSYVSVCQHSDTACVLPVQCPAHFYHPSMKKCSVLGGRQGICCNTGQNHTDILQIMKERQHTLVRIDDKSLSSIAQHGRLERMSLHAREAELLALERPPIVVFGSASYGHFRNKRVYGMSDLTEVANLANKALEIALATRAFKDRNGVTIQQLEQSMMPQSLRDTPLNFACPLPPKCAPGSEFYRNIDGSCNNPMHSEWGTQFSPYSRLLPPSYADGIWAPRLSAKTSLPLPSPRLISTALFPDADAPNRDYTLMLSQFGQFISHDLTFSIDTTFHNGSAISCCTEDGSEILSPRQLHYSCMPIHVPEDDQFYAAYNVHCMNFVRSALAPRQDCTLGYSQQMNKITHFIDGSVIYGSTEQQVGELRSFEGGRLKVFLDYGRELLPLAKDPNACLTMERGSACFDSGDSRTNQMISLVAMHTLFLREHNRIAREIENLNPHWPDEKIFLETRKIVIAEIQVIIYKEFLPCLLGETTMEEFGLNITPRYTYSDDYDPTVNPSITNEFSAAAYRFGHSMVDGLLRVYGKNKMEEVINIPEVMFQPARMRKTEFFDEILSTLTTEPIQKVDNFMSEALTRYLFKAGNPFGIDLAAVNIQRGRDHGLRPYNDYREVIGLGRMSSFDDFGFEVGNKLRQIYDTVEDIDLWVGGLLEPKGSGSVLGPTFTDIIADQFTKLKKGDRYFFDNDPTINPSHFNSEQLNELKMVTMSRIICDNSDGIVLLKQALNAFKKPGAFGNEFVECESSAIPSLDLTFWQA